jgi:light-regulated signal transduction histidine kinase (bacteriophytochrome)
MTERVDLDDCAAEPIRIPGGIQPHGALLVLSPADFRVLQSSVNVAAVLGMDGGAAPRVLDDLPACTPDLAGELRAWLADGELQMLCSIIIGGKPHQVSAHRTAQGVIVEFEPVEEADLEHFDRMLPRLRQFLDRVEAVHDLDQLCYETAREIRRLTQFNRVVIYRFDEDWNGTVIGEDGDGVLPSYMDLRFPATDIPAQARDLYRMNRLRLIPTATYEPVPLAPPLLDGAPLDMSLAALRSVSPVHREYMRNMGTAASMSVSLLIDRQLWGLISCHHATPKTVSPQVRAACDFLGRIVAQQIGVRERMQEVSSRFDLKEIETELVARLSREDNYQIGLANNPGLWMRLAGGAGAALVTGDTVLTVGDAPSAARVLALARWLGGRHLGGVFETDSLQSVWPDGGDVAGTASGVLAIPISQLHASFMLWFRPEQVRTVAWGGDPHKAASLVDGRLHPRRSFEIWKELVRGRSRPWSRAEVESAADFRGAIVNFVLRRAEERAELTDELERSNNELEAFSYSVSHDLRAPFRHIVGYAELLSDREHALDTTSRHYLDSIRASALSAVQLVDDLLNFSRLGRSQLSMTQVDMQKLVEELRRSAGTDISDRAVEWDIGALPAAWGDGALLRQALANLIDNALKYSRHSDPARIIIKGEVIDRQTVYSVTDNGVGFDMAYAGKLFGVFQRLHRVDEFEGTGIGLALAKRIIDRHGGWVRAEGTPGEGATFTFGLPTR